jgi:uncharacterized protein YdeI (YjbR/CyaY-like superfamily)
MCRRRARFGFTNVGEIVKMEPILKAYIKEAIAVEKAGLEVTYKGTSEFVIPEEFQSKLDEMPALKNCFRCPDPGTAKRIYSLFFLQPNNPKPGSQGLRNAHRQFSTERD